MDALLLLAIEADKESKRKREPVCKMADSVGDVQKAVLNIAIGIGELSGEVAAIASIAVDARDAAKKAASRKAPDYVMDIVRGIDDRITRIDVKAIPQTRATK